MAEYDNTIFAQPALDLGLKNVVEIATAMGVTTPGDPYPATAIGGLGTGVSALEMASAEEVHRRYGYESGPPAVI